MVRYTWYVSSPQKKFAYKSVLDHINGNAPLMGEMEDFEDIMMKQREESHNGTNVTEVVTENLLNYFAARK